MWFACTLVGLLMVASACLGNDNEPPAHLGGLDAPLFADLGDLISTAERAGVPCEEPEPFDAYAGFATDQEYPPTEAVRCRDNRTSTVFFLYETVEDGHNYWTTTRGSFQPPGAASRWGAGCIDRPSSALPPSPSEGRPPTGISR